MRMYHTKTKIQSEWKFALLEYPFQHCHLQLCLFIMWVLRGGGGEGQGEEMNHQRCFDFMTKVQLEAYLPDSPLSYTIRVYTLSYNFLLFFIPVKQMQPQGEKSYNGHKMSLSLQAKSHPDLHPVSMCLFACIKETRGSLWKPPIYLEMFYGHKVTSFSI